MNAKRKTGGTGHERTHPTIRAEIPPPVALLQMITGYWISQTIYVVAKLGITDLLKDGPKSSDELAKATGVHARSLYRLLRALASVGVFAEGKNGRFGLTPIGECLQTEVSGSMRALAIMHGEEHYRALHSAARWIKSLAFGTQRILR